MAGYWASGYWHANYWQTAYWGVYVDPAPAGEWWADNYWHANYWATGYWAAGSGPTTTVSQTTTPSMTMAGQIATVQLSVEVATTTPTMTMTGQNVDAANDVTVSQVSTPSMTMTGIDITADAGEYYEGNINLTVFMASSFSWTDTVNVTAPTMTMTANPANIEEGGAQPIGVTSTPSMTLSALNTTTSNPIQVEPLTPTMTMTSYDVTTGFGTLMNAGIGSMSMSTLQTNVVGVNADINEFTTTFGTMMMSGLNAEVVYDGARRRRGRARVLPRYLIEIDHQFFEVRTQAEAEALLKGVEDLAEEQIDTDTPIKPVKIKINTSAGKETRATSLLSAIRTTKQRVKKSIEKQQTIHRNKGIDTEIAQLMDEKIHAEQMDEEAALNALIAADNESARQLRDTVRKMLRDLRL